MTGRSVQHVRDALAMHGIEVQELAADTRTAPLAAQALGTEVGAIVKSLLFIAGDEPVLALVAGDRLADLGTVAHVLGSGNVRLAKPSEVLAITGYAVGGVPPLAHARHLRVLMDRQLFRLPVVYAAAGAGNALFGIAPDRLRILAHAEPADFTTAISPV